MPSSPSEARDMVLEETEADLLVRASGWFDVNLPVA